MLAAIQEINLHLMYGYKMRILRLEKVQQEDKSTKTEWVVKAEDIPCKLSQDKLDTGNGIKEDINPVEESFTVFCPPHVEVKAGDLLEIDGVYYRAGNPFPYPTHQEIKAARRGIA